MSDCVRACVRAYVCACVHSGCDVESIYQNQVSCRQNVAAMNRLQTTLALCLLGLLAASLADETAQTEQVDAGLEREAREVSDDVNTDVDRYEDVMTRNKRHSKQHYARTRDF